MGVWSIIKENKTADHMVQKDLKGLKGLEFFSDDNAKSKKIFLFVYFKILVNEFNC
jgi:hypothetical protein